MNEVVTLSSQTKIQDAWAWALVLISLGVLAASPVIAWGQENSSRPAKPTPEQAEAHHRAFRACMEQVGLKRGGTPPTEEQRSQVDACLKEKGFDRPPPPPRDGQGEGRPPRDGRRPPPRGNGPSEGGATNDTQSSSSSSAVSGAAE